MIRRLSVIALAAVALACSGSGDEKPRLEVVTEGSEFVLGGTGPAPQANVRYTVTNRGSATAFVASCNGHPLVGLEQQTGMEWAQTSAMACLAIYTMDPIALRAGQSITDTYYFHDAGVYRMVLAYSRDASAPSETATSGAVTVR